MRPDVRNLFSGHPQRRTGFPEEGYVAGGAATKRLPSHEPPLYRRNTMTHQVSVATNSSALSDAELDGVTGGVVFVWVAGMVAGWAFGEIVNRLQANDSTGGGQDAAQGAGGGDGAGGSGGGR
jgi:hypothetical protein